jgi:MFS superfamily sulfate permease-like transporter
VLEAIIFAVGLSIVDVARRSARPHDAVLGWVERLDRYGDVSVHPDATVTPGVVVYRLDDRFFFANATYVKGRVREAVRAPPTATRWVVFDAEGMSHVDAAGLAALEDLSDSLRGEGIGLAFARLKQPCASVCVARSSSSGSASISIPPSAPPSMPALGRPDEPRTGEAQRRRQLDEIAVTGGALGVGLFGA